MTRADFHEEEITSFPWSPKAGTWHMARVLRVAVAGGPPHIVLNRGNGTATVTIGEADIPSKEIRDAQWFAYRLHSARTSGDPVDRPTAQMAVGGVEPRRIRARKAPKLEPREDVANPTRRQIYALLRDCGHNYVTVEDIRRYAGLPKNRRINFALQRLVADGKLKVSKPKGTYLIIR